MGKLGLGVLGIAMAFCLMTNPVVAEAAGKITGAQIKNGTVASTDVKDGTLLTTDFAPSAVAALKGATGPAGAPGVQGPAGALGRQVVQNSIVVPANTAKADFNALCPAGKVLVGGSSWWSESNQATQTVFNNTFASAFTPGVPAQDTLYVQAICVNG